MYNPYLDDSDFAPLDVSPPAKEDSALPQLAGDIITKLGGLSGVAQLFAKKEKSPPKPVPEDSGEGGFLEGLKTRFHLEDIDSGDILLVIIVIYLMLEGDDKLELAITMGILALMWYLDHKEKAED